QALQLSMGKTGTATVSGVFTHFDDEYETRCTDSGPDSGRDAVFTLDLDGGPYDVTVDTEGSSADTILGVSAGSCGRKSFEENAACHDNIDTGKNEQSRIWLHRLSHTRLYILVDSRKGETGSFKLNVKVEDARDDTCQEPFDISEGGLLVGTLPFGNGSVDDGSCAPGPSIDVRPEAVVATFEGPPSGTSKATLVAYSNYFVPTLHVHSASCDGDEIGCEAGNKAGNYGVAQLNLTLQGKAKYIAVVDGPPFSVNLSSGGFALLLDP
ncbi:MAG: hypothetical protein KC416_10950, partial [Myxococcales bacterium]|nr:hypothetical protein [Myxococcales bacterium]